MNSTIELISHADASLQRFEKIDGFEWNDLCFAHPGFQPRTITEIVRLYKTIIISKNPLAYGTFVFFHIEEGMQIPLPMETVFGTCFSPSVAVSIHLNGMVKKGLITVDATLQCTDPKIEQFLQALKSKNLIGMAAGQGEGITFIPVSSKMGFISEISAGRCVVNSLFFLLDPIDMDSPYCEIGTPYGLAIDHGKIINPPLNHRPCLLVDNSGNVRIKSIELQSLTITIDGNEYTHGINATIYERPSTAISPMHEGTDLVITENKIVAYHHGGGTHVPMAGFVLAIAKRLIPSDPSVSYSEIPDGSFGIQVGPPMVKDGVQSLQLDCPFYTADQQGASYPPMVYPLPFATARAARIVLGADENGKPVLIWAEGAGKLKYVAGEDSTGASLSEMAEYCYGLGLTQAVNLDGGGSSLIVYNGMHNLKIADRYADSNHEAERPVPACLLIR